MAKFQVTVRCPVHDRPVYLIVDAVSMEEAKRKAIGRIIPCPWGPADEREHTFEVKEVLAVTHYPWEPPTTISTAPIPSPAYYVPHPPSETLYVIDPEVADRQLRKLRWWER